MGKVILAVDFGSKTSGYTAAALLDSDERVSLHQSVKGKNADEWLKGLIKGCTPDIIAIDAPLSLPGVYSTTEGCTNYHYRQCDLEVNAMSPMFLGGLTARAIEMKDWIQATLRAEVIEIYPKLVAQDLGLDKRYKKDLAYLTEALDILSAELSGDLDASQVTNWHRFDALLALWTASKYAAGAAEKIGLETEGIIYF